LENYTEQMSKIMAILQK